MEWYARILGRANAVVEGGLSTDRKGAEMALCQGFTRDGVMMAKFPIRKLVFFAITLFGFVVPPSTVQAQSPAVRAATLLRDAMEAYGNLDLENSKSLLDQAGALGPQLDNSTLARVYVSFGILWTGGFADNAQGQKNFILGLCLDPEVMVDPLLSSPDIDMIFNLSRSQATAERCPAALAGAGIRSGRVSSTVAGDLPVCGKHTPMNEQKRKYELPFFLEIDSGMARVVKGLKVFYAFDAAANYSELEMIKRNQGYAALLDCDRGQIRIYDPATVAYFIEGYDEGGRVVCAPGSKTAPMLPDIEPMPSIVGMTPKECAPCPPWDEACGKTSFLPGLGAPCQPDVGCNEGLVCNEMGICEFVEESSAAQKSGPKRFYVNLTGGVGFGYQKAEIEVRETEKLEDGSVMLSSKQQTPAGFAFGGVPIRLNIGIFLSDNFSLELVGRFDATVDSLKITNSCLDALERAGVKPDDNGIYSYDDAWGVFCGGPANAKTPEGLDLDGQPGISREEAERLVEVRVNNQTNTQRVATSVAFQIGWMAALRARYRVVHKGGLNISLFLGAGYGQFSYNVPDNAGGSTYFPTVKGMIVELGPEMAYYFNKNVGLVFSLPVDFAFLDGFAVNFDPSLGLSVGF
jgi:hypothetical protein